jgi:pyruvate dehydrogenase E2 component (dihydrolipoamide acetyltransferase)
MSIPITIPRLGWSMEEGTFGGWLKRDGDVVRPGDFLFSLESEKGTEEIECLDGGILRIAADGPKAGERVVVGMVIGHVVDSAEAFVGITPSPPASVGEGRGEGGRVVEGGERRSSPHTQTPLTPNPSLPETGGEGSKTVATPRARRVAAELAIDINAIEGTGRGGRVRERDVRQSGQRNIPITPLRRTIAARLLESRRETVPVTLTTTVDATNLVRLRELHKTTDPVPSYTDLLVKLSAVALQQHPLLGGQWTEEGIRLPEAIHIGIAVDTDRGLYVPVIRDVVSLGIRELAARSKELIDLARHGRLAAADMRGGCFTVTNLGSYGIDAFTPVINYPECAVLGVGRIAKRPAVVGDAIVPRDQMTLSLTFDHRIVDGAPAARFLQTLSQAVEDPTLWLPT